MPVKTTCPRSFDYSGSGVLLDGSWKIEAKAAARSINPVNRKHNPNRHIKIIYDLRPCVSNIYRLVSAFGLVLWWTTASQSVFGQAAGVSLPQGHFLDDTIAVGKPFRFAFTFRHNPGQQVFFPDSSYNYAPFEWVGQDYFTTRTDSLGSLDSTVYRLVCFDFPTQPRYQMPVYVVSGQDCTAVFAPVDTFRFRSVLPMTARLDTLSLRPGTEIQMLRRQFNYPILLASLVVLGLVALAIYWLFGKAIGRQWRLFLLQRRHLDFVRTFNRFNRTARDRNSIGETEKAVVIWKSYLESVERKPFASYTTREIIDSIPDESLENALKEIDRIIYGQAGSKPATEALQTLRKVAQRLYRDRRMQIIELTKHKTY